MKYTTNRRTNRKKDGEKNLFRSNPFKMRGSRKRRRSLKTRKILSSLFAFCKLASPPSLGAMIDNGKLAIKSGKNHDRM